jgi:hypothetical protein
MALLDDDRQVVAWTSDFMYRSELDGRDLGTGFACSIYASNHAPVQFVVPFFVCMYGVLFILLIQPAVLPMPEVPSRYWILCPTFLRYCRGNC